MSIMKLYTLTESVYTTLVDAAKEQLNDIESGVEEGIYEDNDENKKTVEAIRKALDYQPTVDEVAGPMFFRKDKSGRDGHYEISYDDLIEQEEETIEEDEEFADWLYNAEVGDEYTEFNDCTYTRIS